MKRDWIVNREEELRFLKEKFASNKAEFIVMWGRRRVGKTFVLTHFSNQYPSIYYVCVRSSIREQLNMLSETFADFFRDELIRMRPLKNFDEVFLYLSRKRDKRFALIIDEWLKDYEQVAEELGYKVLKKPIKLVKLAEWLEECQQRQSIKEQIENKGKARLRDKKPGADIEGEESRD